MSAPEAIPTGKHLPDDFVAALRPNDLVYFLANVGDADSQLVLLPEDPLGRRRAIVVDVATKGKLASLVDSLVTANLLRPAAPGDDGRPDGSIALVIATHPHSDHIGGIAEFLTWHAGRVEEFWDPGYFHTTQAYHQTMSAIEASPHLTYSQPTAGYRRWFGSALVTVLSPTVGLRNRFDTYGTEINDSSISVRIEFPAARVVLRGNRRELLPQPNTMAMILGADAQTLSWSYVLTDFPQLHRSQSDAARAIGAATGRDLLRARVLKVSHHGSKRGLNLELVERIKPALTLVSNASGGGHGFPHSVAQDILREALQATAGSGSARKKDWDLGIFYTSDSETDGTALGSVAVVMGGGRAVLWRFGDGTRDTIDFAGARRWTG
jgi:hypothetical protein